jgi:hypothetical protein
MTDEARAVTGGYRYWVSDEQLAAFGRLSLLDRLRRGLTVI